MFAEKQQVRGVPLENPTPLEEGPRLRWGRPFHASPGVASSTHAAHSARPAETARVCLSV